MHLFQIEKIAFQPLTVIAEDFDHAADIFMHSLVTGLHHKPKAEFEVTKWRIKSPYDRKAPWSWVQDGNAGMLWRIEDAPSWELIRTKMIRE